MTTRPAISKLVELRSKTDRQLVELITLTLAAAEYDARMEELRGRAERACEEVKRLLPFVTRADRRRFEARLEQVGAVLCPHAQAACF